jgi:isocitrate dehydrogenase kinase/phosphatase
MSYAQDRIQYRDDDETVDQVLDLLWKGFDDYCDTFAAITRRAAVHFEMRDGRGMRADTIERLDLYQKVVTTTCARVVDRLGPNAQNPRIWSALKPRFAGGARYRRDGELACTFYNSVNRRILETVGIEPELEFVAPEPLEPSQSDRSALFYTLAMQQPTSGIIQKLLSNYGFNTPFADIGADARLCAERIRIRLRHLAPNVQTMHIEMLRVPFFREMRAYLIGRLFWQDHQVPLVFALANSDRGLLVDAILLRTEELRVVFSFSHAYFHVQSDCPYDLVMFLKELMPAKRIAELYIGLGYNKHGKTELYRDLLAHQQVCSLDLFDFAAGQRGMVMIAFNMPRDDLIYKLIRDRFASPKNATRRQVMEKYDYVFKHDRAGRLIDVQTFENLEIQQCCLKPELLDEIRSEARLTASVEKNRIVLHHVYVERRLTPLDLYLKQADAQAAKAAVIDYGRAIKDLAQINIFPGDMLIKNFGVTLLGRVVFYDYDELCALTDCNFRWLPQARGYDEEMAAEPWFTVAENDVFPEEFASFLALAPDLRQIFLQHHNDLLTPLFWQQVQEKIRSAVVTPILPYTEAQRLRPARRG